MRHPSNFMFYHDCVHIVSYLSIIYYMITATQ